jgi:hypothetical protein
LIKTNLVDERASESSKQLLGLGVRLGLAVLLAVLLVLAGSGEGCGAGEELVGDVGLVDFARGELRREGETGKSMRRKDSYLVVGVSLVRVTTEESHICQV